MQKEFKKSIDLCMRCYNMMKSSEGKNVNKKTSNSFFKGFCQFIFARECLSKKNFTNENLSEDELNMFWDFVKCFNDDLDDEVKFKKEKIGNNVSAWTSNQRNKHKKGTQPEIFTSFLQEIDFEFRSKYNAKRNNGNDSGKEQEAVVEEDV